MSLPKVCVFGKGRYLRAIARPMFFIPRCISPLSVTAANRPPGPGQHHSAGAAVVQGEVCWEGGATLHLPAMVRPAREQVGQPAGEECLNLTLNVIWSIFR